MPQYLHSFQLFGTAKTNSEITRNWRQLAEQAQQKMRGMTFRMAEFGDQSAHFKLCSYIMPMIMYQIIFQQSRKPYDIYVLPHGLTLLLQELIQNTLKCAISRTSPYENWDQQNTEFCHSCLKIKVFPSKTIKNRQVDAWIKAFWGFARAAYLVAPTCTSTQWSPCRQKVFDLLSTVLSMRYRDSLQ